MYFGFALDSWNLDLWDIALLDIDLDLLVGQSKIQIPSVKTLFISKTSQKHVFKTSSGCLQRNNFSFPRRFHDVFKTSWKMKNCYAEEVLKTSSRQVLKKTWRLLKTSKCFPDSDLSFLSERKKNSCMQQACIHSVCCLHKSFKASIKSWTNTKKSVVKVLLKCYWSVIIV